MKHATRLTPDGTKPNPGLRDKSQTEMLEAHLARAVPLARKARAAAIDPLKFRAWFAPKFADWLRENYGTSERVAVAFGVRHSTACNWLNGANKASGDSTALAFLRAPDAVAWFLAEWEGGQ